MLCTVWLLRHLPSLPCFQLVYPSLAAALRQACQVESDPDTVSLYIRYVVKFYTDPDAAAPALLHKLVYPSLATVSLYIRYVVKFYKPWRTRKGRLDVGPLFFCTHCTQPGPKPVSASESVSDPDPIWIRIPWPPGSVFRMRIRIQEG
jgi:hypothetical protein